MPESSLRLTETTNVRLPTVTGFKALTEPELTWLQLAQIPRDAPGPFVYVLTDGRLVYYIGKSDAVDGVGAKRAAAYPRWVAAYTAAVADGQLPDPMQDPISGDLDLCGWSSIVRLAAHYNLYPLVASVAGTPEAGAVWEARLKALSGSLTALESLGGGSVWERKPGTLRYHGYEWAAQRIETFRRS